MLSRCLCIGALGGLVVSLCAAPGAAAEKAAFRVLYSNDTTNIQSCVTSFHKDGERFREEMLEAEVDETAGIGVDVHLMQPGVGWVPWWKSKVYPFEDHVRFMKERFGKEPSEDGFAEYMANGGDMVAVFVARCREKGLAPFISLRLNDGHGLEFLERPPEEIPSWTWRVFTPAYVDHPEWRIGSNLRSWGERVLNWAYPEVRALKFRFIEELCEQYDIDGFELDFMRYVNFFDAKETTSAQRRKIMADFVRDTRRVLDRTAKNGQHRWLCVRIPCYLETHDKLGIEVRAFAEAGVDMFNLSSYYFTEQQTDAAAIKALVPDCSVYLETAHTTHVGERVGKYGYAGNTYRRTTDLQFYTAAHLAYARGLDGMSAFNLFYYREHGAKERAPFHEPPFHVFKHLGDPAWLARQPQHYILAQVWDAPRLKARPLPKTLSAGERAAFEFDMAPPEGGWTKEGRLRIQAPASLGDSQWAATFNDTPLEETADRSEPYESPYLGLLGTAEQHRAWTVPAALVKDGVNTIAVQMKAGEDKHKIVFVDLAIE